jgi:predicted nucleotidyltransferase
MVGSTFELLEALERDWTASAQPAGAAPNLSPSRRGEPMASVLEIRQRLRGQRIEVLRRAIEPLLAGRAGAEVWLFGSLARGDWDARSDVDLLAVAPNQSAADQLAEALLRTGLADDVIGLSQGRWLQRQRGDDPWWRGICRDAICLQPTLQP